MPSNTIDGQKHLVLATIDEEARPISVRVLGAYAESLGVRTTLLVILHRLASYSNPVTYSQREISQLAEFLEHNRVTHLGFYLMTASLKPYRLLVPALRKAGFRGVIMAGGVHPTLQPEESMVDGSDFAVQGPGEIPLEMILRGRPPETIPGLVWREGKTIRVNPPSKEQSLELDQLPFPLVRFDRDWILVNGRLRPLDWAMNRRYADWHGRYLDIVTSRGCPYRCAYCCNVYGAPVRRASVDRVIRELRHIKETEPRIQAFNIQDDSFYAGQDDWFNEFCSRYKSEVGMPFIARMIPRFVTPERIEKLKDAGLEYVTMGLEGSNRLNREIYNRKEDSQTFLKAAQIILSAGLLLSIDFIMHNPYETEDDLREVARTLNALPRPNWWIVSLSMTAFPHTAFYDRCLRDGMLDKLSTDPYDAMMIPSRPGSYRTPPFWLNLITIVLPHLNPGLGNALINMGPRDAKAVRIVMSMARWIRTTKKITTWMRDRAPWLYKAVYRVLRVFSRRRPLASGMKIVD